jgi:hypothetical protein
VRKASVADLVCRWRLQRSLGDGADMRHACSYKTCTYHQISNSFICERTGRVHECGDMCGERVVRSSPAGLTAQHSYSSIDRMLKSSTDAGGRERHDGVRGVGALLRRVA